jgi:hypothetical protein
VQWDDDDWYGPSRLRAQVAPLAAGTADVTALRDAVWFDTRTWTFRIPTAATYRRLFVGDVHAGTLALTGTTMRPRRSGPRCRWSAA